VKDLMSLLKDYPEIDVNWANQNNFQRTALHHASIYGHVEVVKLLLAHPAIHVNKKNWLEATPFQSACLIGQDPVSSSRWLGERQHFVERLRSCLQIQDPSSTKIIQAFVYFFSFSEDKYRERKKEKEKLFPKLFLNTPSHNINSDKIAVHQSCQPDASTAQTALANGQSTAHDSGPLPLPSAPKCAGAPAALPPQPRP